MRKLLSGVLGLMICMAFGCKKGEPLHKVYLLSRQVIDDRVDGLSMDTTNFFYDDQNHLTLVTTSDGQKFPITYDAAGRVDVAKTINANGTTIKQFTFFYTPTVGFFERALGKKNDTGYFSFNDKHQVTKIRTVHAGYSTFSYDERGNIANLENYAADSTLDLHDKVFYTYDNKKSPFSDVAPNNYFLMYILYADASTLINNALTRNADAYSYTYNNDGLPVQAMAKVIGHQPAPIYYYYIVK